MTGADCSENCGKILYSLSRERLVTRGYTPPSKTVKIGHVSRRDHPTGACAQCDPCVVCKTTENKISKCNKEPDGTLGCFRTRTLAAAHKPHHLI
eukprot:5432742-Prymnesium_polylepis.1